MKKKRISTDETDKSFGDNPFGNINLSGLDLSEKTSESKIVQQEPEAAAKPKLGRVDIRREKAGRGGKTVTTIEGIMSAKERNEWLKKLQKTCGCGGSVKGEAVELQGDKRDEVAKILTGAGYRVVFSGG